MVNRRIVAAAGGDQRFAFQPVPGRDANAWAPRFGFNYRAGEKLVLRGGYGRTYDSAFLNIAANAGTAFPFMNTVTLPARTPNSLEAMRRAAGTATIPNPDLLTRTTVSADFRSPFAEQFSVQLQRELWRDWALGLGWVATKGTALFQTIDGNPTVPGSNGRQRVDAAKGVIRERCNCTASTYHSMQATVEKRLSAGLSMGAHYTWSSFIDGASDIFNSSASGEVAIAQDSLQPPGRPRPRQLRPAPSPHGQLGL